MANSQLLSLFSIILFTTTLAYSQTTHPSCKSLTFPKKTFKNCNDLPTLNAVLHYTYTPSQSTLSMAFTAAPTDKNGWVAWALNPKATGMVGSQTLMAFKPTQSGPVTVNTLDIQSYNNIVKGPISYNVTGVSAEVTNGCTTIFATWVIPSGEKSVNTVWQVGPVADGKPGPHAFDAENIGSTMVLTLPSGSTGAPVAGAPAGAPAKSPEGAPKTIIASEPVAATPASTPAASPAPVAQSGGAQMSVVSVLTVLVALVVCIL